MPAQLVEVTPPSPASSLAGSSAGPGDGLAVPASTMAAATMAPATTRLLPPPAAPGSHRWRWKVDLEATEPYWGEWFAGLSAAFLAAPVAKLLVLAGINTLDTPLVIGQMQGKFQLHVVEGVGHAVHEDAPDKVDPDNDIRFKTLSQGPCVDCVV